jgi:hypothetical protein
MDPQQSSHKMGHQGNKMIGGVQISCIEVQNGTWPDIQDIAQVMLMALSDLKPCTFVWSSQLPLHLQLI